MDDAFSVVGAIIVIALVVFIFGAAIMLILGAILGFLIATIIFFLSSYIILFFIKNEILNKLSSVSIKSNLITINPNNLNLAFCPDEKAINRFVREYNFITLAICLATMAIVFFSIYDHIIANDSGTLFFSVLVIIAAIITEVIYIFNYNKNPINSTVRHSLEKCINDINQHFKVISHLKKIMEDNYDIVKTIEVSFDQDHISNIYERIKSNISIVLNNPIELQKIINSEIHIAKENNKQLYTVIDLLEESYSLLETLASLMKDSITSNNTLENLHYRLKNIKNKFIPKKEWSNFKEEINIFISDLKKFIKNAYDNSHSRNKGTFNDPYVELGVSPEMTDKEIRTIFRSLCKIYHPDKGKVKDDNKFKLINNAYETIMHQRKK